MQYNNAKVADWDVTFQDGSAVRITNSYQPVQQYGFLYFKDSNQNIVKAYRADSIREFGPAPESTPQIVVSSVRIQKRGRRKSGVKTRI